MVRLVADQFYLIVTALFLAVSFGVIFWSRRGRLRESGATGVPGVRIAAIAGVVSCLLVGSVVVPLVLVLVRAFQSTQPDTSTIGPLLFPALILFALVFLAVLDIYALSPPRPGDRAGAVGRGVLGPGLVAVGIVVAFQMQGALASASRQQAQAEEAGALEARSDGLSISVTVVDARPGEPTEDGRIVLQLTVDLVVRSVSEIKLRQTNDGLDNQVIRFVAPASPDVAFFGGPGLPREIPAGFDQTYRLDVLVVDNVPGTPPSRAGPWTATLELIGPNDAAGSPIRYETSTSFTVPDAP